MTGGDSQHGRVLDDVMKEGVWPRPITTRVADVTDEEQFPNIAEAERWARENKL